MKKILKYFLIIIICLIILVPNIAIASTDKSSNIAVENFLEKLNDYDNILDNLYYKDDYNITSFNVDIKVNENNTFDITETIDVKFNIPSHGIYRKIPLKNTIYRDEENKTYNTARVSKISINESYTTYKEDNYKILKIGDSEKTKYGSTTYIIKYTYNIGRDPLIDLDEFYFNLIGDQWDTTISNVTFKIEMPKKFDESLLHFFTGKLGSTDNSNVEYEITGNTITGKLNTTLKKGENLTVRLSLPKDYFVYWKIDEFSLGLIIYCLICILIANYLWLKYGKNSPTIETVEFYPPEDYNSAEIGFLYEGKASDDSIISLLFYLASKGYLKIEKIGKKDSFTKLSGFKIIKLKDYDGTNQIEKLFFNALFKNGRKKIDTKDLQNNFYKTVAAIRKKLNLMKKKIFTKTYNVLQIFITISILIAINIKPLVEYRGKSAFGDMLGILSIEIILAIIHFSILITLNMQKKYRILLYTIWGFISMTIIIVDVWPGLLLNTFYMLTYAIGIICIGILILFITAMDKRTPYGNKILGKIKGFKRFLDVTEKEQLESLVAENPEYFYNILPYTFALGISDKWVNQFRNIALGPPYWFETTGEFNSESFSNYICKTMRYTTKVMASNPSQKTTYKNSNSNRSSNSFSSNNYSSGTRGGFSGGGSGGGGGSRW